MKKFLSLLLAVLFVFSVMAPITVFAENGPYPYDPDNEDVNLDEFSTIMFMDILADLADYDDPMDAIGMLYPYEEGYVLPKAFKGASYDLETNTLTLNNVNLNTVALYVTEMGDDFKINLKGYNELATIVSSASKRGASITITGDGELVVNRLNEMSGICIDAGETASVFHVEDSAKLKVYSDPEINQPSITVYSSTVLDSAEIIKLGGEVVADEPKFERYTLDILEQLDAYDLEMNDIGYYEVGLEKDGAYYIADEYFDPEIYDYSGKYIVYSVAYDEILGCYTATKYANGEPVAIDDFTILTEFDAIYDKARGYYIGYVYYSEDETSSAYKSVFYPEEKEPFDLCVDENGTKYGFWQYTYEYNDGTSETETYVYNFINHPTYGYVAIEDISKSTLDGLTPLKIGEKELADSYVSSDLVINNGGAIIEPEKIKNIKATNTNQGVKITWNADPVAEKYRIYRKVPNGNWKVLDTVAASQTSFIDKTAKSGKEYIYTVKGYNFVGWGTPNQTGVTHTFIDAPDATIKTVSSGVKLNWAKVAGATKYRIYRQTEGSSKWTRLDTVKGTSFTDKTAKSGKKYYYRVRAAKGDVMSGYNVVSKYFLSAPKLSSVKNSASGVKVTWEKVTGAEGYKIYRKSGSGSFKLIGTTTNNKTFSYTDKTAKSGTTYTYTVKAYKSKTNSAYNKTGLKLKYLAAPKAQAKIYTSSINISWDKVVGAKEYAVYRKADGESKWTKLTTTEKLSYKDSSVKNNKTYSYRVKAINGKTVSSYKTVKCPFLKTPSVTSITNTGYGQKITWNKTPGADGYKIYVKVDDDSSWTLLKTITDPSKTSYKNDKLRYGLVYKYTVRAYNDNVTSALDKKGDNLRYIAPVPFYMESTKKGVSLGWGNMARIDQYKIYRKAEGESKWSVIATITSDDEYTPHFEYIDTNVKKGKDYSYRVVALDHDENNKGGYQTQTITYK